MNHKWNADGDVYRCGWCAQTLPRNAEGRALALGWHKAGCDRKTPAQRKAEDDATDAVDAEIQRWHRGEAVELSDAAQRELDRRHRYHGRKAGGLRLAMMAAALLGSPGSGRRL